MARFDAAPGAQLKPAKVRYHQVDGNSLTIGHVVMLQLLAPYQQPSTAFFAVATGLTLTCTLLAALLIVQSDDETQPLIDGVDPTFALTVIILTFNFSVLVGVLLLLGHQIKTERQRTATLRVEETGLPPILSLSNHLTWHLFISYNWASQDVWEG